MGERSLGRCSSIRSRSRLSAGRRRSRALGRSTWCPLGGSGGWGIHPQPDLHRHSLHLDREPRRDGKGQTFVCEALDDIRNKLPFEMRGIDSDNGSEFINHHLTAYCKANGIGFTRSRPYKKDDNAHVEQKNWTHVRKLFGYLRYDSQQALGEMNDLYRGELRLFQNLFLTSVRLTAKRRIGSRLRRSYDAAKTPSTDCSMRRAVWVSGSQRSEPSGNAWTPSFSRRASTRSCGESTPSPTSATTRGSARRHLELQRGDATGMHQLRCVRPGAFWSAVFSPSPPHPLSRGG